MSEPTTPHCVFSGHKIKTDRDYFDLGDKCYCCEMHVVPYIRKLEGALAEAQVRADICERALVANALRERRRSQR